MMTLHQATTLAISAHAVSIARQAVARMPRQGAQDVRRAEAAEREAVWRWQRVRKILTGKRRIAA